MARRSFGVVLIVALLGWTVNRPLMECESQHSRAAVVVLAGASPAYQPEPSPTRHSCCPHEQEAAIQPSSPAQDCHHQVASHHDCCSLTAEISGTIPAALSKQTPSSDYVIASVSETDEPIQQQNSVAFASTDSSGIPAPSFSVLRL